jgi:hypothetical protein
MGGEHACNLLDTSILTQEKIQQFHLTLQCLATEELGGRFREGSCYPIELSRMYIFIWGVPKYLSMASFPFSEFRFVEEEKNHNDDRYEHKMPMKSMRIDAKHKTLSESH